jgi:hypothetical protein
LWQRRGGKGEKENRRGGEVRKWKEEILQSHHVQLSKKHPK